MRKSNIFKLLLTILVCYSFILPSYGFDFSDDIIIAGVETAGVGGGAGETYLACNTAKCNELKESLTPINEGLTIYNKELVRLINQLSDPEIVDMIKKAEKLKQEIDKQANNNKNCNEMSKYLDLIQLIISQSSINSSHITQIKNVLALQVDMKKNLLDQLKVASDDSGFYNKVKKQGIELKGREDN